MGMIDHKAALIAQMQREGGLRDAPDGPVLECFKALELAQCIESEIGKPGTTKVRLDMTHVDAQALATYLRRAVLMGL